MAEVNLDRLGRFFEGPVYVAVGFGVLGFQRAQVWRRGWERRVMRRAGAAMADQVSGALRGRFTGAPAPKLGPMGRSLTDMAGGAASRLAPLAFSAAGQAAERFGQAAGEAASRVRPAAGEVVGEAAERWGPIAAQMGERLPPEARELLDAASDLVADLPGEAREVAREVAAFGRLALQVVRAPASRPSYP